MKQERVNLIKKKLDAWGIKRQWLANQLNVSKSQLSMWLNGTITMPEDMLREAEKVLNKIPD